MTRDIALAVLGLTSGEITEDRINEAYRAAVRMNHPDKYARDEQLREHAEEQCKLINEAREVLLSGSWERPYSGNGYRRSPNSGQDSTNTEASTTGADGGHGTHQDEQDEDRDRTQNREAGRAAPTVNTPFLDVWKTSALCSVLGAICYLALNVIENSLYDIAPLFELLMGIARIALQVVYAAHAYPALFGASPKLKSIETVSFCNFLFGFLLFGPIWNHNLTRRTKGVSYVVYIACNVAVLVLIVAGFLTTLSNG